ncbi:hypothetical protein DFH09DRAFT_1196897 [Mycena vulgaris]|nr:hypothetical protein DFH09DRAFT_1196897 [Mycena vulgaris]
MAGRKAGRGRGRTLRPSCALVMLLRRPHSHSTPGWIGRTPGTHTHTPWWDGAAFAGCRGGGLRRWGMRARGWVRAEDACPRRRPLARGGVGAMTALALHNGNARRAMERYGAARQWRRRYMETRQRVGTGYAMAGDDRGVGVRFDGRSRSAASAMRLSTSDARPPFAAAPRPPRSSFAILAHGGSRPCGVVPLRGWGATE